MTTIVGYVEPGVAVWIGGDTRIVAADIVAVTNPNKIVRIGRFLVGYAGDMLLGNLLHEMSGSRPRNIAELCAKMRRSVVSAEFASKSDDGEYGAPNYGQELLVAERHNLWDVSGSFSYNEVPPKRLAAAGSGSWLAMGAGHALKRSPGRTIVQRALDAAAAFDTMTGRPFTIEKIDW